MDVEKSFDGANKEIGVVLRLRDVRITVTGVIEGVDGEKLRQIRHDLFEKVELRAQRMEQDEVRPHASLDVADLDVLNVGVLDGNGGGPSQRFGGVWGGGGGVNGVLGEPQNKQRERQKDIYFRQAPERHCVFWKDLCQVGTLVFPLRLAQETANLQWEAKATWRRSTPDQNGCPRFSSASGR